MIDILACAFLVFGLLGVLKDGEQKIAQHAEAHIGTPTLLRMHRSENRIAAFHAEHERYWEDVAREEASNA